MFDFQPESWTLETDAELNTQLKQWTETLLSQFKRIDGGLATLEERVTQQSLRLSNAAPHIELLSNRLPLPQQSSAALAESMAGLSLHAVPTLALGADGNAVDVSHADVSAAHDDVNGKADIMAAAEAAYAACAMQQAPQHTMPHIYGSIEFKQDSDLGLGREVVSNLPSAPLPPPQSPAPSTPRAARPPQPTQSMTRDEGVSWTVQDFKQIMDAALRGERRGDIIAHHHHDRIAQQLNSSLTGQTASSGGSPQPLFFTPPHTLPPSSPSPASSRRNRHSSRHGRSHLGGSDGAVEHDSTTDQSMQRVRRRRKQRSDVDASASTSRHRRTHSSSSASTLAPHAASPPADAPFLTPSFTPFDAAVDDGNAQHAAMATARTTDTVHNNGDDTTAQHAAVGDENPQHMAVATTAHTTDTPRNNNGDDTTAQHAGGSNGADQHAAAQSGTADLSKAGLAACSMHAEVCENNDANHSTQHGTAPRHNEDDSAA